MVYGEYDHTLTIPPTIPKNRNKLNTDKKKLIKILMQHFSATFFFF